MSTRWTVTLPPSRSRSPTHRDETLSVFPGCCGRGSPEVWTSGPPSEPKVREPGEAMRCTVTHRESPHDEEHALVNDRTPASPSALLEGSQLMRQGTADVFRHRERSRLKKVLR